MKCAIENECRICDRLFCCAKCRSQHEKKKHPEDINNLELIENECYICNEKPLLFEPNKIPEDLLAHIVKKHFPLYCKKCSKMYWTEEDLFANWKCERQNLPCKLESGVSAIINSPLSVGQLSSKDLNNAYAMAVSTQTTPSLLQLDINKNDPVITPIISSIGLQTKPQISSVNASLMEHSSVKNSSAFNTPAQLPSNGTSNRGKLVRTTSTPMQVLINKPKEHHFDSSSHVSSIHATSGESDVITNSASLSSGRIHGKLQRTRGRGKIPVSATPLRQVMSKSIQRAIAEHGTINLRHKGFQPKKIFDSLSGSFTPPLDLRTSPVLRRTQSEIVDRSSLYEEFHTSRTSSRKHIITSTKQIITEDVIISSNSTYEKLETVYETCHSVATPLLQSKNIKMLRISPSKVERLDLDTPTTATAEKKKQSTVCSSPQNSAGSESNNDEIYYTPKSNTTSPNLDANNLENENSFCASVKPTQSCPEQFFRGNRNDQENTKPVYRGRLWSLVSSVMRLASFGNSNDSPEEPNGLLKRCASFAGVISKTLTKEDAGSVPQVKRKRTNTFDAHSTVFLDSVYDAKLLEGPTKKMKRIQGRRPIDRMRNMT